MLEQRYGHLGFCWKACSYSLLVHFDLIIRAFLLFFVHIRQGHNLQVFVFVLFFFFTFSFTSCLHILEINPFLVALFASIFSQSISCHFILFMVSFTMQQLLSLIRSHLLIFVFIYITLANSSKKVFLQFMSKSVLPMFSSGSFIVTRLTLRYLIHF